MEEKPATLTRYLRYPICTIVSFFLVLGLCLECFLTNVTTEGSTDGISEQPTLTLPLSDASTLVDLQDFRFLMNNLVCADVPPVLLVMVHSAPSNRDLRNAVRGTWAAAAKSSSNYKVLFLLGEVDSPDLQASLEAENQENHDLVQGSFFDDAHNVTYKHVMALKWAVYHCPKTRVIFKVDDDTFLNTRTILEFFSQDLPAFWTKRLILCNLSPNLNAERNVTATQYVPESEYPSSTYPPHCHGKAIAYSPDIALALYRAAQKEDYFRLDNVHVTGTLAQAINASLVPFGPLSLDPSQAAEMVPTTGEESKPTAWPFWTGPMGITPEYMYQFWNSTQIEGKGGRPLEYMHMRLCPYP